MIITTSSFKTSSPSWRLCPDEGMPEFAFIGRSNVGKSSLINMITGSKALAKVSGTPGKTRLINHFLINNSWYLVDLPGYGYAKTSRSDARNIGLIIEGYLVHRKSLRITFLLIDSRHLPQKIDLEFMGWLQLKKIPFVLLFTKADKITRAEQISNTAAYKRVLSESLGIDPEIILTSSVRKMGREEILGRIEEKV